MTKILYKTDEHVPFHDKRAVELAYKICEDFEPDIVPAGSDGMDHYKISSFDKDPASRVTIEKEIEAWKEVERGWRSAAPDARHIFIQGNHEDRLRRYMWKKASELYDLEALKPENLYGLKELDIEYSPRGFEVDDCIFHHGTVVRKYSGYTARAEIEKLHYSKHSFTGHTHRMGSHYTTTPNGLVMSVEGGCLCRTDLEYITNPNWQQGITLVWTKPTTFTQIPFIRKGRRLFARWNNKEYMA